MKRMITAALIAVVAAATGVGIDAGSRMAAVAAAAPLETGAAALTGEQSAACADLMSLALPNTEITGAEAVAAGAFTPPGGGGRAAQMYAALPAFCRVLATLTPSSDSDIKVEIWLHADTDDWNGKYQAVGNGAFTGSIRHASLAQALARGYAGSSTDTGHEGNTASFGLGHPEKVIDFGWRAVHEMSVVSKAVVESYYDEGPRYSYWVGCSAGGRQAMKAAQRFPDDFDGIVAGAPGNAWTDRAAAALRVAKPLEADPAMQLPEATRQLVHAAALEACDASDGVTDGVVGDPERCDFDPSVLACQGSGGADCLTPPQMNAVRMLYSSPENPATGRPITGLLPGSELGWTDLGWTNSARSTGLEQFRYLTFADPEWTIDRFNFETDIVRAEEEDNDTLNALDPNLQPFFDRGGKMIGYHGWSDPQISPANATQYYGRVAERLGGRDAVHDNYRLFMAPGMGHCAGGNGPSRFDMLTALEAWVEEGEAPDHVLAAREREGRVDRTRPLCPYPEQAIYSGNGSTDDAANFSCRMQSE